MSQPEPTRYMWMDALRGIAILLVVVNHAALIASLLTFDLPPLSQSFNPALTPFRMPPWSSCRECYWIGQFGTHGRNTFAAS